MNPTYEAIDFNKEIPVNLLLHSVSFIQNHWHDALEILFVLEGSINIYGQGNQTTLDTEDIYIICPGQIHCITSTTQNVVLLMQVPKDLTDKYLGQIFSLKQNIGDLSKLELKKKLSEIIWSYNKKASFVSIKQLSLLYNILFLLAREFLDFTFDSRLESSKYSDRIGGLIRFIREHYQEDISLKTLSVNYHMTPSYVSRFFSKNVGISFKNYLSNLRLEHAVKELVSTDKNILEVALESGFPNVKSLATEFRRVYSGTINEYRKKYKQNKKITLDIKRSNSNYTELLNNEYFSTLFKYLQLNVKTPDDEIAVKTCQYSISCGKTEKPDIHAYWKKIMSVGRAKDLLREDLRTQLREVQREIGFYSIRFHGIFDDTMMVCTEGFDGNMTFNFDYIHNVLDFLLSINLKPFIELGFMPRLLAKNRTPYFFSPVYPSPPGDINKWRQLLREFFLNLFERYTKDEVCSWLFEFWNEPELLGVFWKGTDLEFLEFYSISFNAIKEISPAIKIGGPSISQLSGMEEWLDHYFEFCKNNSCMPDFFTFHFYPHDESTELISKDLANGKHLPRISPDVDFLNSCITGAVTLLKKHGYSKNDIYVSEWNSSAFHRELTHDTLFKACYLVKNIVQNYNTVSGLAYWTISDIIEEFPMPSETFHGGIGLITKEGIKKAGYYAMYLLNKLGEHLIEAGKHYAVTKSGNEIQIMLFNYCHFDNLYCNNDRSMINKLDRYGVFSGDEPMELSLKLYDLPFAPTRLKEYILSKNSGSAYDEWLSMGYPESLTREEVEILKSSKPGYKVSQLKTQGLLEISRILKPHEVRLIILS